MRPRLAYDKEYILSRVEIDPVTGCWNWNGERNSNGYGKISNTSGFRLAHRLAHNIWVGPPGRLLVCHHCDNPPCCNPDHLFRGTHLDNIRDAAAKGRMTGPRCPNPLKGEACPKSKLTDMQVREIRESIGSLRAIAARFPVSYETIRLIRKRLMWKHLPDT